jgi:hypothetical protein
MTLQAVFRNVRQWFTQTPERALEQAYEAALNIKKIEDDYFDGNPINPDYGGYGESAYAYFQSEVEKSITLIKRQMSVFRASSTLFSLADSQSSQTAPGDGEDDTLDLIDKPAIIFKKLRFIDSILDRYTILPPLSASSTSNIIESNVIANTLAKPQTASSTNASDDKRAGLADRSSVLPRSILRTVDRVKQDLDPKAEVQVMRDFRSSQAKTKVALRFILLLVIVPLLTQQFTKNFIIGPIVDYSRAATEAEVFLKRRNGGRSPP